MNLETAYCGEMTRNQFASISEMVRDACGIRLHDGKQALVKARLNKRLRTLGLSDFTQYISRVRADSTGTEKDAMVEAICTNTTHFFRENRHFDLLDGSVLDDILARRRQDRKIRIWSAGCSSGEEAYSAAITLIESRRADGWDVGVLGTDISGAMIRLARRGVYDADRLREAPPGTTLKHFEPTAESGRPAWRIREGPRRMTHFARLNLMDNWPMKCLFDVIFCRNVMIYFDKAFQAVLVGRLFQRLSPGGMLFIGHSESLTGIPHRFKYVEPAVYYKKP